MAGKITRQTFIQFGVNVNAAADICEFGTPATGTPVYTNVIATLQALAAWTTGWAAETVANNRPFLEDMNAVCYVFSYMIAYILQMGIAEYDAGTTYFANSICQTGGVCYQCINDNSGAGISGIVPTNATYWKLLIPPISGILGAWTNKAFSTIYGPNSTDGFIVGWWEADNGDVLNVVTDASSSPSTIRFQGGTGSTTTQCVQGICVPTRKGDYWEAYAASGSVGPTDALFFIPQGS